MNEPKSLNKIDIIEHTYQQKHCVDGVSFVGYKDNDRLATDDDNALYTGLYLGAAAYRAATNKNESILGQFRQDDIDSVVGALEGVSLLTNVTGTPGALVRQVFPTWDSWDRIGYHPKKSLDDPDNSFGEKIREGRIYHGIFAEKKYAYTTKTTKDQISGILFGLTCAWYLVPQVRPAVAQIVKDLWNRMQDTDYSLRDHKNETFGTSAHELDEPLVLCLDSLYRAVVVGEGRTFGKRGSWFFHPFWNWVMTRHYNRWIQNTYSYNLNLILAHSLFLLKSENKCEKGIAQWTKTLYARITGDENPHFDILGRGRLTTASAENLERRINEPYHKGFCWSKDPDDWFDNESDKEGPGIDALLPYWMNRYSVNK